MIAKLNTHSQKGFSLLELLLSIGVVVTLFVTVSVVFDDWFKDSIDRKAAREIQRLHDAASEYVELNIDTIITNDIPNVGDVDEIAIADLIAQGFLPAGYGAINSYRQNMRVFVRNLAQNTINGDAVEVISLSDGNQIEDNRLFSAASNAEPSIGIISNLNINATCCNGNIQSISGSWSIPLTAAYFGGAVFPTLPTPNANGGYIAAYNIVSSSNLLTSNYLYRNNVPTDPDLNKMETNLILSNTDITNAGYIVSDSTDVTGNVDFSGLEPNGTTASAYVLAVRDNLTIGQDLNVIDNGDPLKGNVTIEGDEGVGIDFNVTGVMNVNTNAGVGGNVAANIIDTDNISIANSAQFGLLNNNNASLVAGNIYTTNAEFTNSVTADVLQVINSANINAVDSDTAVTGTTFVTNPGGLSVPPTIDVGNNMTSASTINTNNINVNTTANITRMTRCRSGCP